MRSLVAERVRDLQVEFTGCAVQVVIEIDVGTVIKDQDHFLAGLRDVAEPAIDADSIRGVVVLQ